MNNSKTQASQPVANQRPEKNSLENQLLHAQRMQIIGTLAAGLGHDFNNLLEVILGFASLARLRLPPDDPLLEPLNMIEQSAERAAELTRQMLDLAQSEEEPPTPFSLADTLARVVKMVSRTFDRRIRVVSRLEPNLPWVEGNAGRLEQAILNLCLNARDAMPEGGTLTLEARTRKLRGKSSRRPASGPPGAYVAVTVRDTGVGMESEILGQIFEPFFSTKRKGEGAGLGLAMVDRMVKTHRGSVKVESKVGKGTTITLLLPAVSPPPSTAQQPTDLKPLPQGSGTVLVVDDEPLVVSFVEQGLTRLGYKVLKAESGRRACELYARHADRVDVVLLDMVMPEMSGLETHTQLKTINPDVKVILSSGYSVGRMAREGRGAGFFLGKPYTLEALSLALQKVRYG